MGIKNFVYIPTNDDTLLSVTCYDTPDYILVEKKFRNKFEIDPNKTLLNPHLLTDLGV